MRILAAALLGGGLLVALGQGGPAPALAQDLERAVSESYPTNLALLTQVSEASVKQMLMGFQAPTEARILVEAADRNEANWFVEDLVLSRLTEWGYQPFLKAPSPVPERPSGGSTPAGGPKQAKQTPPPPPPSTAGSLSDMMSGARPDSGSVAGFGPDSTAADPSAPAGSDSVSTPSPTPSPATGGTEPDGDEERPEYVLRYRVVQFDLTYPKSYRTSPFGSRKVQRRASVSLTAHLLRGGREEVVWGGHGEVERIDVVPQNKLSLLEGTTFPFQAPKLETKGWGSLVEPALVTAIAVGLIYLFYTNQN